MESSATRDSRPRFSAVGFDRPYLVSARGAGGSSTVGVRVPPPHHSLAFGSLLVRQAVSGTRPSRSALGFRARVPPPHHSLAFGSPVHVRPGGGRSQKIHAASHAGRNRGKRHVTATQGDGDVAGLRGGRRDSSGRRIAADDRGWSDAQRGKRRLLDETGRSPVIAAVRRLEDADRRPGVERS